MADDSLNTATIPLTNGGCALVNTEDLERISSARWHRSHYGYAVRFVGRRVVWMHREVMRASADFEVDHVNGDKLDNRKSNLRLASHAQNCRNQQTRVSPTSGYIGVGFHKRSGKWRAHIGFDHKHLHLGLFDTAEEAHAARRAAEKTYFGEFAPRRPTR